MAIQYLMGPPRLLVARQLDGALNSGKKSYEEN